jgi:membrane protease YdiL (CAAX protease family)
VRTWPDGRSLNDDECVTMSCVDCRTHWRIHNRLRGFRLRCDCGAWLALPAPPDAASPALLTGGSEPNLPVSFDPAQARLDERGLVQLPGDEHDGEVIYSEIPVQAPMAPGTLRRASNANQTRWTNATVLEFAFLMAALLAPQVAVVLFSSGNETELLLPLASAVSCVLVGVVIVVAGPFGRVGLRGARPRYFLEALGVAALSVGLATLYVAGLDALLPDTESGLEGLTERLGLPLALFVVAVTPAILEEVIFRGMLQGRLMALMGRFGGMFVTAAAFAVVHGQPAALPIHLSLGLYLGWLRERADSLLPCMLMHFLYNGTLVTLEHFSLG